MMNWLMNPTFPESFVTTVNNYLGDFGIILLGIVKMILILFIGTLPFLLPAVFCAIKIYKGISKRLDEQQKLLLHTNTAKIIKFPSNPEEYRKNRKRIINNQ